MAIPLYEAVVPTFLQLLGGLDAVLDKGLAHAEAIGIHPEALAHARLADDMFPLYLQVRRVADHSKGALEDVAKGRFTAPIQDPLDYAGMQALVADARTAVQGWTPDAVNALEGGEFVFDTGSSRSLFTAEAYLLTFALPNFHFHLVTAYDILRAQGVSIGKRDYLGQMRLTLGAA